MKLLNRRRISLGKYALVPIGICRWGLTGSVEFGDLFGCELPADSGKIGAGLFFVARANDECGNSRALQQPVEGDLRNGLASFPGNRVNGVNHGVEIFVGNRRAGLSVELGLQARNGRQWLTAPDFTGQSRPTQWTPNHGANFRSEEH